MKHHRLFQQIILSVLFFCFSFSHVFAASYPSSIQSKISDPDFELLPKDHGTVHQSTNDVTADKKMELPARKINSSGTGLALDFSEKAIALAGFILTEEIGVGSIVKILDNTLVASDNEIIYVDLGLEKGVKKGDRFTVFSNERIIYDFVQATPDHRKQELPFSTDFDYWGSKRNEESRELGEAQLPFDEPAKKIIGVLVKILGVVEIIEPLDGYSRAEVIRAHNDIQINDSLLPYEEMEIPQYTPGKTNKTIDGRLIAFKEEHITGVIGDIVYIDRGTNHKVQTGDFFEAYEIPTLKKITEYNEEEIQSFPPHVIGKMQVISTRANNSTAIILYSEKDFIVGQRIRFSPEN